jgi:hypothetical protein
VYLELGANRSLDGAYRKARGLQTTTKRVAGRWQHWYELYQWKDRAEAYDQHLSLLEFQNAEESIKQKASAALARREEIRQQELELAQKLISRATEMLGFPLVEKTVEKDGKTVILKPADWSLSDIPRFVEVGDKLLRLSNDMETARVALEVDKAIDASLEEIFNVLEKILEPDDLKRATEELSKLSSKENKRLN